jgi:threonine/homoserine/homoserine lactone efflux protein
MAENEPTAHDETPDPPHERLASALPILFVVLLIIGGGYIFYTTYDRAPATRTTETTTPAAK